MFHYLHENFDVCAMELLAFHQMIFHHSGHLRATATKFYYFIIRHLSSIPLILFPFVEIVGLVTFLPTFPVFHILLDFLKYLLQPFFFYL